MTTISFAASAVDLPVDAASVWHLIGGFGSLATWLPFIEMCELGEHGRTRRLRTPDGDVMVERLMQFDEAKFSYSYSIVDAPFPVTDYLSTLRVQPHAGGCRVFWDGRFCPDGVSVADAAAPFQKMYDDGLAALAERYRRTPTAASA
jgi:hypothetical protein